MIFLYVALCLAVLLLSCSYALFRIAVARGWERPWEDPASLERYIGPEHVALVRKGLAWLEEQKPQDHFLQSFDGLRLRGRWLPAPSALGTIILFHGWRSSVVGDFSPVLPFYQKLGFNLLLVDQRSHGKSQGKYITFGVRESRDAADWVSLHNREFGTCPVYLGGISMGATTVLLASGAGLPNNVAGVIADCGFSSPCEIMKSVTKERLHLPAFPLLYLVDFWCRVAARFDPKAASAVLAQKNNFLPTLFLHGEADRFVPCQMSRDAYAACAGKKQLLLVPNAGHGRSYLTDQPRCQSVLENFLIEHLPK